MKLQVESLELGALGTNCYFACNRETGECLIIDPAAQAQSIVTWLVRYQKKPVAVLLTHGHFDHTGAAEELREKYGISIYASLLESDILSNPRANLSSMWGSKPIRLKADKWVQDGQILDLAGFEIHVIATPGHTEGGVCYYIEEEDTLFSGDTLFAGSYGRVDFPTGSMSQIYRSVHDKLLVLPEKTKVYPGHGAFTDIGTEKAMNPLA